MADLVKVPGALGRVYVRFNPDDTADTRALGMFRRAGARLDRNNGLWFVPEYQRQAALAAVVETAGSMEEREDPKPEWILAADAGLTLLSGWILVGAGPEGIWYRNPYSSNPTDDVVLTWEQAANAVFSAPASHCGAIEELIQAAEALAGRGPVRPHQIHGDLSHVACELERLGCRFDSAKRAWTVPAANEKAVRELIEQRQPGFTGPGETSATPEQLGELDTLLMSMSKLGARGEKQAEVFRARIELAGGWIALTTNTAARILTGANEVVRSLRGWV